MKNLKSIFGVASATLFLFLTSIFNFPVFAQQITGNEITLVGSAPSGVTQANARIVGNPGFGTAYYWFVAVYGIGQARVYGPLQVNGVPNVLSVSNYVQLNWNLVATATSYTVLKTTSPLLPNGTNNIALVSGNTSGTTNDTGGALAAFTPNAVAGASGNIFINNTSYTEARFQFSIPLQVTKICFSDGTCQTTAGSGGINYSCNITTATGSITLNTCQIRMGGNNVTLTTPAVLTITSGTGTVWLQIDNDASTIRFIHDLTTVSCSGCTATAGSGFSANAGYKLFTIPVTATIPGTAIDARNALNTENLIAGSNMSITRSGNQTTLDVVGPLPYSTVVDSDNWTIWEDFPNTYGASAGPAYGTLGWAQKGASCIAVGPNNAGSTSDPGQFYVVASTQDVMCTANAATVNSGEVGWLNLNPSTGTAANFEWKYSFVTDVNSGSVATTSLRFGFTNDNTTYRGGSYIALRYDTTAVACTFGTTSTTNFVFEVSNAGTSTCIDTGVAATGATRYITRMRNSGSSLTMEIATGSGAFSAPVSISTNIPNVFLWPFLQSMNRAAAGNVRFHALYWGLNLKGITRN